MPSCMSWFNANQNSRLYVTHTQCTHTQHLAERHSSILFECIAVALSVMRHVALKVAAVAVVLLVRLMDEDHWPSSF